MNAVRANPYQFLVGLTINRTLESYWAVLHNDSNRLDHRQRITVWFGKAIDGSIESKTQPIVVG